MAGARARAVSGAILLALVPLVPMLAPPQLRAADEATQVLPGEAGAAVVADIDGDGARELVRILNESGDVETVDAWGYDGGGWSLIGNASLAIAVESQEPPADDVATRVDIAEALLVWHADGVERVLVLTARTEYAVGTSPPVNPCCLSIFELHSSGDDIALLRLPYEGIAGQFVRVLDVDADGTDEIVVSATAADPEDNGLEMLRWSGTAFESALALTGPEVGYGVWTGDSDGLAGDDLLFGPTAEGEVQRVSWVDGEMHTERAHLDLGERFNGWIAGIAGGRLVVQADTAMRAVSVVRWPRDDVPQVLSSLSFFEFPSIWVVGTDEDALVLRQDDFGLGPRPTRDPPSTIVYDLDLHRLGEVEPGSGAARLYSMAFGSSIGVNNLGRGIYPPVGPLWGTTGDGRPAFIAIGALIQPGGGRGYEVQAMASLPGLQPVGTAGPAGSWIALINGYVGPPTDAYLYPGGPGFGRISVAPMADVLRPDGIDARPALELRNAVEPGEAVGGVRSLLAAGDGFAAVVDAPAGSYVISSNGLTTHDYDVSEEPLVVDITPWRRTEDGENQPLEASLIIITPDGRASMVSWSGTYLREPPELTVAGRTDSMALSATLTGRASEGATVTVDGQLVAGDANGEFEASVDAPIWPRRVIVVARDPFGRETVTHLEVVGVLDYRGWPWAALVVGVTVAVGATLFVRTPRRKPAAAAARAGDGRLEELELEDLEELTRAQVRRR